MEDLDIIGISELVEYWNTYGHVCRLLGYNGFMEYQQKS
jgi:hypothetical protein